MGVKASSRWKGILGESTFSGRVKRARAEREKAGKKVFELYEGDPVLFGYSNQPLSNHLIQAVKEGWHMYPAMTPWRRRLRNAISTFEKRYRNVDYSPEDVILAPGVAGCYQVLHYTLFDAHDEILAIEPTHYLTGPTSYLYYFQSNVISCRSEKTKNWEPDLEELRGKITNRTKGIVVVNPNNPTGVIHKNRILRSIIDIAGEYDIPIIADEIYGLITFDDVKAESIAAIAKDVPVIILNGISKLFMRTGWRVGYMCFHDPQEKMSEVLKVAKKIAESYGHATTCIPTPILVAATKTFEGSIDAGREMVKRLQNHRDFTYKRLNEISGISCPKPEATLYAFPGVHAIGEVWKTDADFILELLKEEGIIFRPGSVYGRSGAGHFRTLLLPELQILKEVYDRLERFMIKHSA